MPVYNECDTIEQILAAVVAVDLDLELVVVDDCSTDGTSAILNQWPTAFACCATRTTAARALLCARR
jgi:glycosyltransferase involved in cell wall biosynthesis